MKGYRYENKYIITTADYLTLTTRLKTLMSPDENVVNSEGEYFIRSLYFDDEFQSGLEDKREGALEREKFRIRFYNFDRSFIRLESKQKHNFLTRKESANLTYEEVKNILDGDIWDLFNSEYELVRSFYLKSRLRHLRPKVIVDYVREAYTYNDVRITFDKNIRTANYQTNIFSKGVITLPCLPSNMMVLEVKYDDDLPYVIKKLLQPLAASQTAFSKYDMCRRFQ